MMRFYLLVGCLLMSVFSSAARAEPGGVTISPPLKQVVLHPSAPTPVSFSVTNNSAYPQTYKLRAVDFKSLYESGGVAFLGQDVTSEKYGLAKWLKLNEQQITLAPRETRSVTANIPATISPGGHYCAILLAAQSQVIEGGSGRVDLQQVASALVFAVKTGGAKYSIRFDSFVGLSRWQLAPPQKVRVRFYNAGNVQAIPRGLVQITDPRGKIVGQGAINGETGMVLPESHRQYVVPVNVLSAAWLPGPYHVKALYRHEGTDKVQVFSQTILVMNWYLIAGLSIFLTCMVTAITLFFRRRRRTAS